ncbi:alpha/beta hydrolase [Spirosoma sp. SC4-14]|uniref:alpha/beta fold hydrolase n=1 Tax=Spirosoma sp. SC4-14 TaxID=3128900 RepID=UPI0030D46D5D
MPRVFLLHGYVEDPTIFDQLVPLLPQSDFTRIDLADECQHWKPTGKINVQKVAEYLVNRYAITANDLLIGHSMGGWIAIYIKQLTQATVIQISSWTDQRKIRLPTHNLSILKFLLFSGVTQSRPLLRFFQKQYPFPESFELYKNLMEGMRQMNRGYLYWQLQILFAEAPHLTVSPDLRIHTRRDSIIARPNEPYTEVPGDHFSLVFHPKEVAEAVRTGIYMI